MKLIKYLVLCLLVVLFFVFSAASFYLALASGGVDYTWFDRLMLWANYFLWAGLALLPLDDLGAFEK